MRRENSSTGCPSCQASQFPEDQAHDHKLLEMGDENHMALHKMIGACSALNAGSDGQEPDSPADNPFDREFAGWAESFRPEIRRHLIGGPDVEAKPRESQAARLQALQGKSDADQLHEARVIIQNLER